MEQIASVPGLDPFSPSNQNPCVPGGSVHLVGSETMHFVHRRGEDSHVMLYCYGLANGVSPCVKPSVKPNSHLNYSNSLNLMKRIGSHMTYKPNHAEI